MERRRFLLELAAAAVTPALLGASNDSASSPLLERALVLSGGGARGAYQAGIVGALAAAAGVSDGTPLPGYGLVAGTSIGALNGWFVATGQYQRLRDLWYGVSGANPVELKPQFAPLRDPESGVLNKARSAVSFIGLAQNVQGLFQTKPAFDWIVRHIDPATPLLVPLAWAVTNLAEHRAEYFFIRSQNAGEELNRTVVRDLQRSLGPQTVVREATPDLLQRAIFASVAIPIAFDPVMMPDSNGTLVPYCDGGVASNSPVGIAHAMASAADVVLVDPPLEPETDYKDAIDIAFGAYATMQRKIIETEMRTAYFQSVERNTLSRLTPREIATATNGDRSLVQFIDDAPATTLRYIRPKEALPVGLIDFDDQVGIGRAYRLGWEDVASGFRVYDWKTFVL